MTIRQLIKILEAIKLLIIAENTNNDPNKQCEPMSARQCQKLIDYLKTEYEKRYGAKS